MTHWSVFVEFTVLSLMIGGSGHLLPWMIQSILRAGLPH